MAFTVSIYHAKVNQSFFFFAAMCRCSIVAAQCLVLARTRYHEYFPTLAPCIMHLFTTSVAREVLGRVIVKCGEVGSRGQNKKAETQDIIWLVCWAASEAHANYLLSSVGFYFLVHMPCEL